MPTISKNKPYSFIKNLEFYTIKRIKDMGSHPSEDHLNKLLELFKQDLSIDLKREIASSIGRQLDDDI
ncbi:methyltransferase, partial [Helicobacter pylori]